MSSDKSKRAIITGSERSAVPGARETGTLNGEERIEVTVIVRPNLQSTYPTESSHQSYLSREQFARTHSASEGDLITIQNFAREQLLDIIESSALRRTIRLSGTISRFCNAFGVELKRYEHPTAGRSFRGRTGALYAPTEVAPLLQAVLGLDDRPQGRTHFRPLLPGQASISSYTPPQVAKLYDFPPGLNGQGQCVGIIELGGGYNPSDLDSYFTSLGINTPKIVAVSVDGGTNSPTGDPTGPDGEVMLDIEIVGSIAPGAQIAVYFAPNTDKGFLDAITTAIHDSQNKPSVISISWGSAENRWTSQAMQSFNQALQDASVLGIPVCVASGDGGSSDGETDGLAHVDFPASAPFALGCGGTRLISSGGTIASEVVWNDESQGGGATGGGVSDIFRLPSWQNKSNVPPSANPGGHVGRGVPDVCGDADPATGYSVRVDGQTTTFGGTSAVAPLWASLIALISQKLGHPAGYLNPFLYEKLPSKGVLEDITSGDNGAYTAKIGWDACTGLGSPDGLKLLNAYGIV
ncbi:MAG: S53 family peptidase [Nitrososphaerales archaeon]